MSKMNRRTALLRSPRTGVTPPPLTHGPWSSPTASTEDRLILAKLPLNAAGSAAVTAGPQIDVSAAGVVTAYLWGEPYFRDAWLNRSNLAQRWNQDSKRVLDTIDGTFMLLIVEPDGFRLINDKVSALTWYCARQGSYLYASNSFGHVMDAADVPFKFNYHAYRHYIYTRSHHYDMSLVDGVFKLLKGHTLDHTLKQRQYYDLRDSFESDITPEMYFDHLGEIMMQTMQSKQVGILASNGYDSRVLCLLLSQHLEHFHVFTYAADTYSETPHLKHFLQQLPKQNYTLHTLRHSMAKGSPHYTPRKLARHAELFLDCFMDLSGNKEHLLYIDALDRMVDMGIDHVVTGCMAGDVRRIIPLYLMELRESDIEDIASPQLLQKFGISNDQLEMLYHGLREDDPWVDDKHYLFGDAQTNYTHPLMLHHGLTQNSLTVYTARALELYRGIDRSKLPGRGGVNMWRDYIDRYMPGAKSVPFDTGITMDVPLEHDPWIADTIDIDYACEQMRQADVFDDEFIDLMRDTYGVQRKPYDATQTFLNLWAWFTNITGQRGKFMESLQRMRQTDPYLKPRGINRSFAIARLRILDRLRIAWDALCALGDRKHPLFRLRAWCKRQWRYKGYAIGSAVYGLIRRTLRLPPWQNIRRRLLGGA